MFATLSPIMFVLLFVYIFGSAIPLPGVSYEEFLLPGIFVQTVIFGSTITGSSLAEDLQKGLIDRFRSLPMARSAVLVGRTVADVGMNIVTIVGDVGHRPAGRLADPYVVRSRRWRPSVCCCCSPSRSPG